MIRKIAELSSRQELGAWRSKEIGWDCDKKAAHEKAAKRYQVFFKRVQESGLES